MERVAVITGASSGIGRALAGRLARDGYAIGLVARRRDLLDQVANEVRAAGGTAAVAVADVGDRLQVLAAIHQIRDDLGPIDLLVANAGVGTPTLLDPVNAVDVEKMFRVNTLGVLYAIEAVLPEMLKRRAGHIAAVSSLAGFQGLPGESGYCASKAAVNCYLDGLRVHLRGTGVAVTTLCPGFVKTPMTAVNTHPMPLMMTADRAADYIAYALRKKKKVYRFPRGTSFLMRLAGWLPDWALARVMGNYNAAPPMVEIP